MATLWPPKPNELLSAAISPSGSDRFSVATSRPMSSGSSRLMVWPEEGITASAEAKRGSEGASIAIVDDEPDMRESISQWLALSGFDAETYASAEEALKQIGPDWPGVVITDMRMPGLDGMGFLKAALEEIIANGTYDQILEKHDLVGGANKEATINGGTS